MTASVGADVESICNKCGDVWHVVVAKVGSDIVKVQCKECGAYHRHRSSRAKAESKSAATKKRTTTRAVSAPAPSFAPDRSLPSRPYSMREVFRAGEQIDHPRFGIGLVESAPEPGKISVLFGEGRKILAQAKPQSTLGTASAPARAGARDDAPQG